MTKLARNSRCLVLFSVCVLTACGNSVVRGQVPAMLNQGSTAQRAELREVLREALGADVQLAEDALREESRLIIERRARRDPRGHRVPGRDLGSPEHFKLLRVDGECVLEHEESERRWRLREASCRPAEQP